MPAIQDVYNERIRPLVVGQVVDMQLSNLISRTVESAAGIGIGRPVTRGTGDRGCVLPTGTKVSIGVTVRHQDVLPKTPNAYAQYESAPIMTRGPIAVVCADAAGVVPGDPVFVVPVTGDFQKSAGANSAVQLPGATWETTTANGAIGVIYLRD